ncbi:hypothetical protein COA17_13140 [Sphingomonas ginsenosidimutans]|uniref:PilZ domain-containing protein n=2 Tax=Sphingomonadaceae TaxID=41297 RepID=A0A2A4HWP4_9SPHN|nr:hypothetical protein COA17_13140 [Sphingomonas ginsenosidimutans]
MTDMPLSHDVAAPAGAPEIVRAPVAAGRGLFRRKKPSRYYRRVDCYAEASLLMISSRVTVDGRVLDISPKGCLFRPGLRYLLHRMDTPIRLTIGDVEIDGRIVNTITRGYGVDFDMEISDELLRSIVD